MPGEDTNEIQPLPSANAEQAAAEQRAPRAARRRRRDAAAAATRPGTPAVQQSESTSFRSAIDAARERVHGAAREATPDDEGENTEPLDERS